MPAAVGAGFLYFGATTAVATAATAVTAAAVQGVIAGAVIGGGASLVKGGNKKDIFKGAFRGAAIGGASAGAFSLGSMGVSAVTEGAVGSTATQQLTKRGLDAAGKTVGTPLAPGESAAPILGAAPTPRPLLSDATAKIAAGGVQGTAIAAGGYYAAQETADAAKEADKRAREERRRLLASNKAASFRFAPARFSFDSTKGRPSADEWWKKTGVNMQRGTANA